MNFPLKHAGQVAALIDHTILKATATQTEVEKLCLEARAIGAFSVCLNSCWLELATRLLKGSQVVPITVVGFPLGANLTRAKADEARLAIAAGAREIDMVLNVGWVKAGQWDAVADDIAEVCRACGLLPVKVILETCYLTDDEIVRACKVAVHAGAAFVKTSTGFGSGGATPEQIRLMRKTVGSEIGVKASGGIRSWADFAKMIDAGANRVGSSNSVKIIEEFVAAGVQS